MLTYLTDQNFDELVLNADKPTLVKFGFEGCRPCKNAEPFIEQLIQEYGGRFNAYNVDTEVCPLTAQKYRINAAPTILFFKNGEKTNSKVTGFSNGTVKMIKDVLDLLLQKNMLRADNMNVPAIVESNRNSGIGFRGLSIIEIKGLERIVQIIPYGSTNFLIVFKNYMRFFDVNKKEIKEPVFFHDNNNNKIDIINVAFDSSRRILAIVDGKNVYIFNINGNLLHTLNEPTGSITDITFSSKGKMIGSSIHNDEIFIWDADDWSSIVLEENFNKIQYVKTTEDGNFLYLVSNGLVNRSGFAELIKIDLNTNKTISRISLIEDGDFSYEEFENYCVYSGKIIHGFELSEEDKYAIITLKEYTLLNDVEEVSSRYNIRVFNSSDNTLTANQKIDSPYSVEKNEQFIVCTAKDGRLVTTTFDDDLIRILQLPQLLLIKQFSLSTPAEFSINYANDRKQPSEEIDSSKDPIEKVKLNSLLFSNDNKHLLIFSSNNYYVDDILVYGYDSLSLFV